MNLKQILASAIVAAPAALIASTAWAVPCETDADCDEGQYCMPEEDCACPGDGSECICPGECVGFEDEPIDDAECASDADCPTGFICEISTEEICMGMGCPPGEDCPEEDFCEEYTYAMCVPDLAPCEADADCADGLICLTYEYEECEDSARMPPPCAPGEDCPEPEGHDEPSCETVSESFCAPPYVAPCEVDSDCGEGFACVPEEVCWCSGSSGGGSSGSSGGSSGGGVPDDEPTPTPDVPDDGEDSGGDDDGFGDDEPTDPEWDEDCGCEATGDFYCEPLEIACAADADCPDGWTCEDFGTVSATCYEDPDTGEVICEEEEADEAAYCMPPYYDFWGGGSAGEDASGYDDVLGEASGRGDTDDDGSITGGGASQGADDDGRPESEGCSAAGHAPASPLFAGLVLGLVGLARRRR